MRDLRSFRSLVTSHPSAYLALCAADTCGMTPARFYGESDLCFYVHEGELFSESHDELALHVWRDGAWVELEFNDRPQ